MLADIENSPDDSVPRKSAFRFLLDYSTGIALFSLFLAYCIFAGFLWMDQNSRLYGTWGYAPLAAVLVVTMVLMACVLARPHESSPGISSPFPGWVVVLCRAGCVAWHALLSFVCLSSIIILVVGLIHPKSFNILWGALTLGCSIWFILPAYRWYRRCRREHVIIAQNEERYGDTVYVCIPVFKICGHFIVVVRNQKYELRLDAGTHRKPIFIERPLHPGEAEQMRNSLAYHWFVVGWTRRSHAEIINVFTQSIAAFGRYHIIENNCRHFLQIACWHFMDGVSVWHENMLMVLSEGTDHVFFVLKMGMMMGKSIQREFYRWLWVRWIGADWEISSAAEYRHLAFIEDLLDHEVVPGND